MTDLGHIDWSERASCEIELSPDLKNEKQAARLAMFYLTGPGYDVRPYRVDHDWIDLRSILGPRSQVRLPRSHLHAMTALLKWGLIAGDQPADCPDFITHSERFLRMEVLDHVSSLEQGD